MPQKLTFKGCKQIRRLLILLTHYLLYSPTYYLIKKRLNLPLNNKRHFVNKLMSQQGDRNKPLANPTFACKPINSSVLPA